jgi:plastocyanin
MRAIEVVVVGVLGLMAAAPAAPQVSARGVVWAAARREPNVVVWVDAPDAPVLPAKRTVLDQRNLAFAPLVVAVRVGTQVEFPNNDRVFHNVFSYRDGKRFDLGLYPVGAMKPVTFDRPGLSRIFCNIHPNMAAYVLAVDSSYFAVSGADGTFTLPPLPPAAYVFHAWRAGASTLTGSITIDGQSPLEIRWP